MELFEMAFNRNTIYRSIFINAKSVTEFPNAFELKEKKPELFKQWEFLCASKYNLDKYSIPEDSYMLMVDDLYKQKGIFFAEFSKIVAINYGVVTEPTEENGKPQRKIKKFVDVDEFKVIEGFIKDISQFKDPNSLPILCGHNIINNDIPLIIKRLFNYRDKMEASNGIVPLIFKKFLNSKPWDSLVIDTVNAWKFNGIANTPLQVICDFVGLKKAAEIMEMNELSKYYWDNIKENEEETLKFVSLQSANQVNLIIQLLFEMRKM